MCTMFMFTFIVVCRDMEFRVNNGSSGHGRIAEVCIDDQWHEVTSAKVVNSSHQSPPNISIQVDSTSVMIMWSSPNDTIISEYDLSCTTSTLSNRQIHEVKIHNVSARTTQAHINGLLPGTEYKCCVNAHIMMNTPLDLISSSCMATWTESTTLTNQKPSSNDFTIELGIGLGTCCLLLFVVCVGSIFINVFLLVARLKKGATIKPPMTNE